MQTEHLVQVAKASVVGTLISLVFVFIFASVALYFPMGSTAQTLVAQTLKALSLLVGSFLSIRGEGGWKKGAIAGLLFTMLTYVSFSSIGGFAWSWKLLLDFMLCEAVGIFSGIASVNLRRSL